MRGYAHKGKTFGSVIESISHRLTEPLDQGRVGCGFLKFCNKNPLLALGKLNVHRLLRSLRLPLPISALYTTALKTSLEVKAPRSLRECPGRKPPCWTRAARAAQVRDAQRDRPALGLPTVPSPCRSSAKQRARVLACLRGLDGASHQPDKFSSRSAVTWFRAASHPERSPSLGRAAGRDAEMPPPAPEDVVALGRAGSRCITEVPRMLQDAHGVSQGAEGSTNTGCLCPS